MDNEPLIIGRYRLGVTLGIGAFGKVKQAAHDFHGDRNVDEDSTKVYARTVGEHMLTGHKVAVKILNRNKVKLMGMEEKVRREINILKLCRHPHIVRLWEVIDTPSEIFMVMEHAPNGELFDYIVSKGRPSPDEAQRLFQQLVTAVEYCHYHFIVHRDLKPENLLLDQENDLKIADFGLSNIMRDGEFLRTSCGSPNYAAPEVIMGSLYAGPEVDVWSCGVILYALLCGSLPFDDESIPALFKKIKSGMYSLPSHLSTYTMDLVPRMLVVDPVKRITIQEIKRHPWFTQMLPLYLTLTPGQLEDETSRVDEEVMAVLCKLPLKGITMDRIRTALAHKGFKKRGEIEHELRVVYELVHGNKLHKERLRQRFSAAKLQGQMPTFTPSIGIVARPGCSAGRTEPNPYPPGVHAKDVSHLTQELVNGPRQESPGILPGPGGPGGAAGATGAGGTNGASKVVTPQPPVKRRKWYLGIQSKKDPAHVMTEVYRALLQLGCEWRVLSSYRIHCLWRPDAVRAPLHSFKTTRVGQVVKRGSGRLGCTAGVDEGDGGALPGSRAEMRNDGLRVVVGLTLYKVQANIYLLDFHKREGDQFSFMKLCANILLQLKTLSAQSKIQVVNRKQGMVVDSQGNMQPSAAAQAISVRQWHEAQRRHPLKEVGMPGGPAAGYPAPWQQSQQLHPHLDDGRVSQAPPPPPPPPPNRNPQKQRQKQDKISLQHHREDHRVTRQGHAQVPQQGSPRLPQQEPQRAPPQGAQEVPQQGRQGVAQEERALPDSGLGQTAQLPDGIPPQELVPRDKRFEPQKQVRIGNDGQRTSPLQVPRGETMQSQPMTTSDQGVEHRFSPHAGIDGLSKKHLKYGEGHGRSRREGVQLVNQIPPGRGSSAEPSAMTFSGPDEADISLHVRPGCLRPGQLVGTISVERVALLVGCRGEDFLVSEVVDCRPPGTTFERAVDLDFGVGVLGGLEVEQGRKAAVGGRDAMEHRQAIKHHLLETRKVLLREDDRTQFFDMLSSGLTSVEYAEHTEHGKGKWYVRAKLERFSRACLGKRLNLESVYDEEMVLAGRPASRELEFVNATDRGLMILVLPTSWSNKDILKMARSMDAHGVGSDATVAKAFEQSIQHGSDGLQVLHLDPREDVCLAEGKECSWVKCTLSYEMGGEARVVLVTAEAEIIAVWDSRIIRDRTRLTVLPGRFSKGAMPLLGLYNVADLAREGCVRSSLKMTLVAVAKGLVEHQDRGQQAPVSTVTSG